MSNEIPQLDRAFAQLVADAMQPHLKRAVDDAVHEYMGQNGDQHRKDHGQTLPAIARFLEDRRAQLEAEALKKAEQEKETARFRSQVKGGLVVGVVLLILNVVARLLGY